MMQKYPRQLLVFLVLRCRDKVCFLCLYFRVDIEDELLAVN